MEADDVSDLFVEGKGIPWDKQDPEAPKSISAEVKGFLSLTSNNYSYEINLLLISELCMCIAAQTIYMAREESTKTLNCRNVVGGYLRKMG
jgi:hypothetical protein